MSLQKKSFILIKKIETMTSEKLRYYFPQVYSGVQLLTNGFARITPADVEKCNSESGMLVIRIALPQVSETGKRTEWTFCM